VLHDGAGDLDGTVPVSVMVHVVMPMVPAVPGFGGRSEKSKQDQGSDDVFHEKELY
jgi:hypothetical protein